MRKATPIVLVLMLISTLSAQQSVRSNSIGQDRGRFAQESEYTLSVQGNKSTLYNQGEVVWIETIQVSEGGFEVSTYHLDDGSTQSRTYQDNRLISEGVGNETRYYYYDSEGLLEKSVFLVAEKLTEMEIYTYDAATRSLSSILTITGDGSSILYFGDSKVQSWFSYTKGTTFTKVVQISDTLQIQQVWDGDTLVKSVQVRMSEEGGIHLTTTEKGLEVHEHYDDEGLLVLRTSVSLTTEYRYTEERSLVESIEKSKDGSRRIIRYEDGKAVSESLYRDDILEKDTLYPSGSGKVETLYDSGKPYCDITYALDGERVLSIRYR
ncbi:MAG TPA: hypothetical protein VJ863_09840 [Sphaerochaeta sp.]|nr:hypothetical protein [Sphaerochaeta sp.]